MKKKTIGVYLDKDVYEQLKKRAKEERRGISNFVSFLIEKEIEEKQQA